MKRILKYIVIVAMMATVFTMALPGVSYAAGLEVPIRPDMVTVSVQYARPLLIITPFISLP